VWLKLDQRDLVVGFGRRERLVQTLIAICVMTVQPAENSETAGSLGTHHEYEWPSEVQDPLELNAPGHGPEPAIHHEHTEVSSIDRGATIVLP